METPVNNYAEILNTIKNLMELLLNDCNTSLKSKLEDVLQSVQKYCELDHEFANILRELSANNKHSSELQEMEQYQSAIKDVPPESTIIYFKEAGLFRVYSDEEFERTFACHVGTYFRGRKVYEIVDNNRPQRIFMLVNTRDIEELEKVQSYITSFLEIKQIIGEVTIYDNGATYEIIIDYVVQNIGERLTFIHELTVHISNVENDPNCSQKITQHEKTDFTTAMMALLPHDKALISGVLNQYITRGIGNSKLPNTTHAHNVAINVDAFINHLQNNCEWYVQGKTIPYDVLYNEYRMFEGDDVQKGTFSKKYQDTLYTKAKRAQVKGKRIQMIKFLCTELFTDRMTQKHGDTTMNEMQQTVQRPIKNSARITATSLSDSVHNIYIIQEREFIKTNENTYKIGKTTQKQNRRFYNYPKDSKLFFYRCVRNCHDIENIMKAKFTETFIHRTDYGNEYYSGNIEDMCELAESIINEYRVQCENNDSD